MAQTGNLATISFATSGFTAKYTEIGTPNESVPVLDDSDLSLPAGSYATKVPGDLIDHGPINCKFWFDIDARPPIRTEETVTITFPKKSTQTNGGTISGKAFITERTGPTLANNQLQSGEFNLQFTGKVGPTYTPGS